VPGYTVSHLNIVKLVYPHEDSPWLSNSYVVAYTSRIHLSRTSLTWFKHGVVRAESRFGNATSPVQHAGPQNYSKRHGMDGPSAYAVSPTFFFGLHSVLTVFSFQGKDFRITVKRRDM
jgi:hypothetical protein